MVLRRVFLVVWLCMFCIIGVSHAALPNGQLIESVACEPNAPQTYEQYVASAQRFAAQEPLRANEEGFHVSPLKNVAAHLLSRDEFKQQTAYVGFECRRIKYASDGLQVVGYLWKPKDTQGKKLPLIIFNRGGSHQGGRLMPWMRFGFYNFVSAGFVVIGSQYRGNDGGEGQEEYGGSEIHDVLNLVPLVASLGYVDTHNMFIAGGSRGGMMTYLALKNGIDVNAAAVSSSDPDMVGEAKRRPLLVSGLLDDVPGFNEHREESLRERSALYWVDKINVPLLILQGGADWRIPPTGPLSLAQKLQAAGKPYELVIYAYDDHMLTLNRADADRRTIAWFKQHMK